MKILSSVLTKFSIIVLFVLSINLLLLTSASAFTVSPASGSYSPGQTVTFQLSAAPETGEMGVELGITVTGMTITGFTPSTGWLVSQATCNSGASAFTSSTVCYLYAGTTAMTAGQSLGTITATMGSTGTATINRGTTQYSTSTTERAATGVAGTYTISGTGTTPVTTLPNTGKEKGIEDYLFLMIGATFFSLAGLAFMLRRNKIN